MHKIKSLLLGSAAVLAAATGARAADLAAIPAPEPVEYVKVCPTYGQGFFFIPGTDTCLKIGGFVYFQIYEHESGTGQGGDRWDGVPFYWGSLYVRNGTTATSPYVVATPAAGAIGQPVGTFLPAGTTLAPGALPNPLASQANTFGTQARMVVNFDARNETAYGTLRSFIQFRVGGSTSMDTDNPDVEMDLAFLQFAGFTAGLAPSILDFDAAVAFGEALGNWNHDIQQLAYTAQFGNGISGTIGIQTAQSDATSVLFNGYTADGKAFGGLTSIGYSYFAHSTLFAPFTAFTTPPVEALNGAPVPWTEDREDKPEVMANLRVDQAWGSAMIGGGVRDQHSRITAGTGTSYVEQTGRAFGWTVVGGLSFKLPAIFPGMFPSGDKLVLRAAYAEGMSRYVWGAPNADVGVPESVWTGVAPTGSTNGVDFFKLQTIPAWSVYAGLTHYWTPELRSNLNLSYNESDVPLGPLSAFGASGKFAAGQVLANLIYSPVKNLDVGVELLYAHYDIDRGVIGAFNGSAITQSCPAATSSSFTASCNGDAFGAIGRIQRNF